VWYIAYYYFIRVLDNYAIILYFISNKQKCLACSITITTTFIFFFYYTSMLLKKCTIIFAVIGITLGTYTYYFSDNLIDSMHNYTNLKIFLWSGSGDGSNEPTQTSTTKKMPSYSVN